jgi:hypothetical protein
VLAAEAAQEGEVALSALRERRYGYGGQRRRDARGEPVAAGERG